MLTLDSLSITAGQAVNITAWTWTEPASSSDTDLTLANDVRSLRADATTGALDRSATAAKIKVYDAGFATLLATFTADDPAFGAAVNGVANGNGMPRGTTGAANGTAAVYRATDGDDAVLWSGTCQAAP